MWTAQDLQPCRKSAQAGRGLSFLFDYFFAKFSKYFSCFNTIKICVGFISQSVLENRSIVHAFLKSNIIAGLPYWNADFLKKSNGTVGSHYGIVDVRFLCIVFFKINMVVCLLT